jgi:hypothetical protein
MGISKDLGLIKDDFTNVGSSFFIAYLIAEVPTGPFTSASSTDFFLQVLTQDISSRKFPPENGWVPTCVFGVSVVQQQQEHSTTILSSLPASSLAFLKQLSPHV